MIDYLPAVNATLNGIAGVLLVLGYIAIKQKHVERHKLLMKSAFVTSCLFLISYLFYHYHRGSKPFEGEGFIKTLYFLILIPHVILAALIVPLILFILWQAHKGNFEKHAKTARWTLPLWLYVSVTGVIIYLMLYQMEFTV